MMFGSSLPPVLIYLHVLFTPMSYLPPCLIYLHVLLPPCLIYLHVLFTSSSYLPPYLIYLQFLFTSISYLPPCLITSMSYLRYLFLFTHSGVQHIVLCFCLIFFFIFCTLCCQFLWIVHF